MSCSNCANSSHILRKSLSQIEQISEPSRIEHPPTKPGSTRGCGVCVGRLAQKRNRNGTQHGGQTKRNGTQTGTQIVSTLMMKGAVYCTDPRLYVPLVFALIRWAPLCISFCAPCSVSFCAPCCYSFRFRFAQARPHRCRKPLCRLALAVVAITRLAR